MAKKPTISQTDKLLLAGLPLNDKQELRKVHVDELHIDKVYQRGTIASTLDRLFGDEFDETALGILEAGERIRSRRLNVVDGFNRLTAIRMRIEAGLSAPDHVLVKVTKGTTQKMEAGMFVKLNDAKAVTGNAKFRARIVEGKEPEITIQKWVEIEGFVLDFLAPGKMTHENTVGNGIHSVVALLTAYNRCQNHLRPALQLLKAACGGIKKGTKRQVALSVPLSLRSGQVVFGLALLLKDTGLSDVEALAKALRRRHIDVSAAWDEVKRTEGHGYDRPRTLSRDLAGLLGYGSKVIRRKAA